MDKEKVYRRSKWKSYIFKERYLVIIIMYTFIFPLLWNVISEHKFIFTPTSAIFAVLHIFILFVIIFITPLMHYSYIILHNDSFIIKNAALPFIKKEFLYAETELCEIGFGVAWANYFKVKYKGKWRIKWFIGLVESKDYDKLVDDFKQKGIKIMIHSNII